ncbi:CehA/McbA family metallohydrolase [Prosthecobacter sp.]|uniref:CehA/McbA family metallohydrolase n=1 Tax=Prosthecobacter sp. TaxID=1965333 RepID=UPI001DEED90C|nr:CehA/McbA family metallohydrolase [Prosthecobacter sp.]MCB1275322.1 CehA/McbA family metallohydrolase [Prosthecobacter sp.]
MNKICALLATLALAAHAEPLEVIEVEGQPLAANARRLVQALDFLGASLPDDTRTRLQDAITKRDAAGVQAVLDPQVLCVVDINPESRVKARRGPAAANVQQAGYTPVLLKVINHATSVAKLHLSSAQAGPSYAGVAKGTMERERQTHLRENENTKGEDRFLEVGVFDSPPMTPNLSGLGVEYVLALIYSSEAGKLEATLAFDIGQGTQDLGFRAEVPVLLDVRPAVTVKLDVKDFEGTPTTARLTFSDSQGHVFPPQARRLAPDFFFQKQIYRANGSTVLLPPGEFTMEASRGPEYRTVKTKVTIPATKEMTLPVKLERWINAADFGYYSGDHHIHAAGCAHYTTPSEGMRPEDMFQQVKGEGLNVGCVLSWGYCFDYQRQFFGPKVDLISEPLTQLKYDMEVSGFGSAALGHVCLLNLRDLVYPGADGIKGWPTWTTPALRWTKQQGGFTGYPHSGSGMQVNSATAAKRMVDLFDANKDARLTADETKDTVLPEPFDKIDADHDGGLNEAELTNSNERVIDLLPNLAIPDAGGHEIFVTTAIGVCDFISAMDTARLLEWNAWYHMLNCGFPLKAAGETDFPCMSGTRVGQGRTYVQLGKVERIDFPKWCEAMAHGHDTYVSDGYAHALNFEVEGQRSGGEVKLAQPGRVKVSVKIAFSSETPLEIAYGGAVPVAGARLTGDTVHYHDTTGANPYAGGKRKVELIVNGRPVATREVIADDQVHDLTFNVDIPHSSWVAVRQFPQLHTNPVNVIVAGKPIRASKQSAQWCAACIEQLWRVRKRNIAPAEREEAKRTFDKAIAIYRRIAAEAPEES